MSDSTAQKIQNILFYSPAIIYSCRAYGDFGATFVSSNITPRLGYTVQECLGNPRFWAENIHPDDCSRIFAAYDSLFDKGSHVHEYRFRKKDGSYIWVHDELRLLRDAAGNPVEIVGSWLDMTERRQAEVALQKSEELFRAFFESNPVPTIISSLSGAVLMINPAFTRNPGYTAEEVVGRNVHELGFWRIPEDRERMVAAIREHGFVSDLESSFYGKGQRPMTCLISSRAVEFDGELRILSTIHDITEQRAAEEALRKLDQAKSDFISIVAHELRTPLVAIIGYSELLEDAASLSSSEEQKAGFIDIIKSNADVLNRLVDDLLDVCRIQLGRSLGIVRKECNLAGIIENVVDSLRVRTGRHTLVFVPSNPLPKAMLVDGGRIAQVLNNLLGNAIKYSPQGGTIKVQTVTGQDQVEVAVVDQGLGMTPEQIECIFDRFYRAEFSNVETSGLGLGMSIVKQIVVDHGGKIAVTSNLGAGTTITFTLPISR